MGENYGKTIRISENTHKQLKEIQHQGRYQTLDNVIQITIWAYLTAKTPLDYIKNLGRNDEHE